MQILHEFLSLTTGIRESLGLSVGGSEVGDEYTEYPRPLLASLQGYVSIFLPCLGYVRGEMRSH